MDFMILGMLVGGVGGAIKNNSAGSVQQSCDDFNKQQETFRNTLNQWKSILGKGQGILQSARDLNIQLANNGIAYKRATKLVHDQFRQRELTTMIMVGVFIFTIILTFLFRYFNVYSNIWSLIVNKK